MILSDKIYINTAELGYRISSLCELFTHKNPEIYQKQKLKLSIRGIPSHLYHYKLANDNGNKVLELPRGGLQRVLQFYTEYGLPMRVLDRRVVHEQIDVQLVDTVLEKQQNDMIEALVENEAGLIEVHPGAGKCLEKGTKVIMFDGSFKEVQNVEVGDILMGDDSTPRRVLNTIKGNGKLFKIKQIKGMDFVCNENHILTLKYTHFAKKIKDKRNNTIIDISIADFNKLVKSSKEKLKCLKTGIDFKAITVKIDPYFLGCWLGDGRSTQTMITTPEKEIKEECYKQAEKYKLDIRIEVADNCENIFLTSTNDRGRKNLLLKELQEYDLIENKHIPEEYLYNDKQVRLQLLAGLLDTDGYLNHNSYEISTKYESLKNGISYLARSLGFYVHVAYEEKQIKPINFKGMYWRILISGNTAQIPLRVARKKSAPRKQKKNCLVSGFTVEQVEDGDYYGFTLDGNGRFLLEDFTITHNSIAILGLISLIKQPTLIIVHEHRLSDQWMGEIRRRLAGNFILGKYDGDLKEDGDIVVGIINSIHTKYMEDPKFFDKFGMVVADECLDPETIITVPTGLKKLKDLTIGDEVITPKGVARIKNKWTSTREAFKYETTQGNYIIASEKHIMHTVKEGYKGLSTNVVNTPISDCTHLLVTRKLPSQRTFTDFNLENYIGFSNYKKSSTTSNYFGIGDYRRVKISAVTPLGIRELIDIELNDEDKLFFANGFVSHNCQHLPANMFLSVLNNIPAKYRIGITGTVKRKDQKEILTYDVLGDIVLEKKASEIKHRITNFDFKVVNTNIRMEIPTIFRWTGQKRENVLDMIKYTTKLVDNNSRNDIIIYEAIDCIKKGYFPLILSDRVEHNELMYERMSTLGFKTVLLIGKTRKKTDWEQIRQDETVQCIVANSKIASEGLDLPRLSALLLTCPSSNQQKLKQQIGRIRRVFPNKPMPLVVDFCDNLAYMVDDAGAPRYLFNYSAKRRIKFYYEMQHEYKNE